MGQNVNTSQSIRSGVNSAMSPVESRCVYAFYFAYCWQSCANMTPSIKQEVHYVSQRHLQSTTEQRPQATCKNLVKIGREVLEICSRAPGIARRGGPGRLSLLGGTVHGAGAERRHGRRSTVELVHHTDRTNSVQHDAGRRSTVDRGRRRRSRKCCQLCSTRVDAQCEDVNKARGVKTKAKAKASKPRRRPETRKAKDKTENAKV